MPLARIEIEQIEARRWVAEVEAGGRPGGPPFRRQSLTAETFDDLMGRIAETYNQQMPPAAPQTKTLAQEGIDAGRPQSQSRAQLDPRPQPEPAPASGAGAARAGRSG